METFASSVKTIWVTDDDVDDLLLFQEAVREQYPAILLTTIKSGDELLLKLDTLPPPDILFLDINMPCTNGYECLKAIRSQSRFHALPIIIYSCSGKEMDVTYSYGLGANLYMRKPSSYQGLLNDIRKVLQLEWKHPKEVTNSHFVGGKYVPFTAL